MVRGVRQIIDRNVGLLWICLAVVPVLVAWGLWARREWGRKLAVAVCWVGILAPPAVVALGYVGRTVSGDGIGPGIAVVFGSVGTVVVSPVAGAIAWYLTRLRTRGLFGVRERVGEQ